jgi:hypothetical protein
VPPIKYAQNNIIPQDPLLQQHGLFVAQAPQRNDQNYDPLLQNILRMMNNMQRVNFL